MPIIDVARGDLQSKLQKTRGLAVVVEQQFNCDKFSPMIQRLSGKYEDATFFQLPCGDSQRYTTIKAYLNGRVTHGTVLMYFNGPTIDQDVARAETRLKLVLDK